MTSITFAQLINPNSVESFFEGTWGRGCALFAGAIATVTDDILSLSSFEELLATLNRANEGWLHFASGEIKAVPLDMVDEQGMLKLQRIREMFARGETLYLTKAERVCIPLMRLTRSIELSLASEGVRVREPVNAHIFLTPPTAQGFALHRDEHASFILQLDGAKEWTIYEPLVDEVPSRRQLRSPGGVDASTLEGRKKLKYTMQAGDVMYMPEWWPHEARALNQHSLHVTLRIFPLRWVDVFRAVFSEHPGLIDTLPRHIWEISASERRLSSLKELIDSELFREPLPRLLETIERSQFLPTAGLPDEGFSQILELDRINLDTVLVRGAGTICRLCEMGDEVSIVFPGGKIRGPSAMKPVFEYLAGTGNLRARDLPPLNGVEYDRLGVVRRFVRDGLLRASRGRA